MPEVSVAAMTAIVVFGAGGRAGRAIANEARARGHVVTGVTRAPDRYADIPIVAGDVTDAASVAAVAARHDVAVHAAVDLTAAPGEFFSRAIAALDDGLARAGVSRLIAVGLASILPTADGPLLMDTPGYPTEYRAFFAGHAAGREALSGSALDWSMLSPSGDFDHGGADLGGYRFAPAHAAHRITYPDFARALVDQIDRPTFSRTHSGVAGAPPEPKPR
jgi:putative NADH-flavin reductase